MPVNAWRWAGTLLLGGILVTALLLPMGITPVPFGQYREAGICAHCGRTRVSTGWWLASPAIHLTTHLEDVEDTPVSALLDRLSPAPVDHLWRAYWGRRTRFGRAATETSGSERPLAHLPLPQEEGLSRIEPTLALEALHERLGDPRHDACDGASPPPWFRSPGWPPVDGQAARAWWATWKNAR